MLLLLIAFGVWAIFISSYLFYLLNIKYGVIGYRKELFDPKYRSFWRDDFKNWNRPAMYLTAIFIFPLRIALMVINIAVVTVLLKVLMKIFRLKDFNEIKSKALYNLFLSIFFISNKVTLFCNGFVRIKHRYQDIPEHSENIKVAEPGEKAPIIVSNHVCDFDSFIIFNTLRQVGFLSKAAFSTTPIVSTYLNLVQTLYVQRDSKESRAQTLENIKKRAERCYNYTEGQNIVNPLCIYPEGTTTNGSNIIRFFRGAFSTDYPVKMMGLLYTGRYIPHLALIPMPDLIFLGMFQPYNSIEVVEFNQHVICKKGMDAREYAEEVRQLMIKGLNLREGDGTYPICMEYEDVLAYCKANKAKQE